MTNEKNPAIQFIKESISNIKTVGTITRSSKYLCKGMIKPVDFSQAKFIIELGAGDGVVTKHILKEMSPDAMLMVFEVNEKFVKSLNDIEDKRLIVVDDSAEKIESYMNDHGFKSIDYVISALPFTIFPDEMVEKIVGTCKRLLKDTGKYIQIHYSLIPAKKYKNIFGNLKINFVPLNIPPAWVLVCNKK